MYKGPTELDDAIKNKEMQWGVTVHYMDENYDTGPSANLFPRLMILVIKLTSSSSV